MFKSKFTALPSFHKRQKCCNKTNGRLCLHFCWCISASKTIFTSSEVGDTLFTMLSAQDCFSRCALLLILHFSLHSAHTVCPSRGLTLGCSHSTRSEKQSSLKQSSAPEAGITHTTLPLLLLPDTVDQSEVRAASCPGYVVCFQACSHC